MHTDLPSLSFGEVNVVCRCLVYAAVRSIGHLVVWIGFLPRQNHRRFSTKSVYLKFIDQQRLCLKSEASGIALTWLAS
jgi:hypothetical protein